MPGFCQMRDFQSNQVDVCVHCPRNLLRGVPVVVDVFEDFIGIKKDLCCNDVCLVLRLRCHIIQHKLLQAMFFCKRTVQPVVTEALQQFVTMRQTEGERLAADVASHLENLESMTNRVEQLVPETVQQYYDKLYKKITELLGDRTVEESRLVTETAVVAEKIAVDEELVRLHSHIAQFRGFLESTEPTGRKMDFLVQEMNREVNTTGSKSQSLEITKLVVDMKSEIEKIREQIQNIE